MKIIYFANIIVAGWIGISSLFFPKTAIQTVFSNNVSYSEAIRITGALWLSIAILSIFGLFYPKRMSLILLFQLIYKSTWLLFVALPAIIKKQAFPKGMAVFFVVWVVILPFIIPWSYLFEE